MRKNQKRYIWIFLKESVEDQTTPDEKGESTKKAGEIDTKVERLAGENSRKNYLK